MLLSIDVEMKSGNATGLLGTIQESDLSPQFRICKGTQSSDSVERQWIDSMLI